MKENKEITVKCPLCHSDILESENSYACEKHDCKFRLPKNILGATITPEDVNKLAMGEQTELKSMTSTKTGNEFKASLKLKANLTDIDFIFEDSKVNDRKIGTCPACGENVVVTDGQYGKYYRCTKCNFRVGQIAGKLLTEAQMKQLLIDRETKIIKGFISKKGNKFDAKVILNQDNKTEFKFE